MHFGRVDSVRQLDPRLPPDSVRTEKFLSLPRAGSTQFFIGCPIWSAKAWVGSLYPPGTVAGDYLRVYSSVFRSVELNSSFYHLPSGGQVSRWRDETPEGFRFCPKVFRGITENLASPQLADLVDQYCQAILQFESRLGLTFAQFPEWFGPAQRGLLEKFLGVWPTEVPLAVELRHPDWFRNHALPDDVVNLFYKRRVATVITDTAGRRDVLHFSLTQPRVLIRFQGNEGSPVDEERLTQWGKRLRKWQSRAMEEIYFFTHQPSDDRIPSTAQQAVHEITGETVRFPEGPARQLELL